MIMTKFNNYCMQTNIQLLQIIYVSDKKLSYMNHKRTVEYEYYGIYKCIHKLNQTIWNI